MRTLENKGTEGEAKLKLHEKNLADNGNRLSTIQKELRENVPTKKAVEELQKQLGRLDERNQEEWRTTSNWRQEVAGDRRKLELLEIELRENEK